MKVYTGKVKSSKIETNLDGKKDVRILEIEVTEPDDVQTIQQVLHVGNDNGIVVDSTAIILEISEAFKIAIAFDDGITPEMGEGSKKIYSQENGSIKAFINLFSDGNIDLNGDADNVTAFQDMKDAFDSLKDTVQTMTTVFNTHKHTGVLAGGASTGTPASSQTPPTADMTNAKVDTVRVP